MLVSKLLNDKAARIISIVLLVCCAASIWTSLNMCLSFFEGNILVQLEDGMKGGLLNGEELSHWIELPERVYFHGEIDGPGRGAVVAMGLNRYLPLIAAQALLMVVLVRGARGRLLEPGNVKLLLWSGLAMLAAALLAPAINLSAVPLIANMFSEAGLSVGLDASKGTHLYQGLSLLLMAYGFKGAAR